MSEEFFHGYTPIASGSREYLERPRINELLGKAVQYPIVSIVAGAGYGKTYAVYSFVRKYNLRTAWMQLSEQDNIGERFWENLASAVTIINKDSAQKLRQMRFPATERQYAQFLTVPRMDLIPNEKYIFVYDDLHLITEKTVLRFIEQAVNNPFPNVTSILISRTEPALNLNLTKPAEEKSTARITESELRFSRNELDAYFRFRHITPDPNTATAIYRDTEGWAFAVYLAGLLLRNHPADAVCIPQALKTNVFKLIESEIMAPLSPELRRFLVKLSLIDDLKAELVREIGNDTLVSEVEKVGYFIRFDSYLGSYRIHNLFMEYLQNQQDELTALEKKEVWNRTAAWYAANNRSMDAILNYEKTGDYNAIVNIVHTLPLVLPRRLAAFILDIIDRAPKTIFRDYPKIFVMRYRILSSMGRFDECNAELLKSLPGLKTMSESSEKHYILRSCYLILGFIGFIRSVNTKCYDFINFFRQAAAESRQTDFRVEAPSNGITLSAYACRVTAPASKREMEEFIETMGKIVPYTVEAMGGCQYGMYELVKGEFAFFRSECDEAEELLRESITRAREKQQYEIENRALFYLLRCFLFRGNAKGIEETLKQLEAELEEPFFPNRFSYYDIVSGWYYIQTGRKDQAAPWIKSDYSESDLNSGAQGLENLVKVKYYIAEKRYPAALAALECRGNMEPLLLGDIELKVLESICHYRLLNRKKAIMLLGEAYSLAAPAGLFMPFAEQGKDMRALVEAAARDMAEGEKIPGISPEWLEKIRREASEYAKKLYRQSEQQTQSRKVHKKNSRLSFRETDVLVGLSQGLTREEIARAASISPNTVKSVTKSIYNKLGALNKADAVRIASEKNILS